MIAITEDTNAFDDALNDAHPWPEVAGIRFAPSDMLRNLDPTAYRKGLLNYLDSTRRQRLRQRTSTEGKLVTTLTEAMDAFDDLLNDARPWPEVAGIRFAPSDMLRNLDPIAYRKGLLDYLDSEGIDLDDLED